MAQTIEPYVPDNHPFPLSISSFRVILNCNNTIQAYVSYVISH